MTNSEIKVSVIMLTYNHENFISKAINSVLEQYGDFNLKLIICDDCSTDNTQQVISNLLKKNNFENNVEYYPHKKNIGMIGNFIFALSKKVGDYFAICDGDDYWIDKNKLRKQIEFLDNNLDYNVCCHSVAELYENVQIIEPTINEIQFKTTYSFEDLINSNFIYSTSVMYRNNIVKDYPTWFEKSPIGDYVLHLLHAHNSKVAYLPDIMAVYRRHKGGVWSSQDAYENSIKYKWLIDQLDLFFDLTYHKKFYSKVFLDNYYNHQLGYFKVKRQVWEYLKIIVQSLKYNRITMRSFGYYILLVRQFIFFKKSI